VSIRALDKSVIWLGQGINASGLIQRSSDLIPMPKLSDQSHRCIAQDYLDDPLQDVMDIRYFGAHTLVEASQEPGFGVGNTIDYFNLQLCRVGAGVAEIGVGGNKFEVNNVVPGDLFVSPANTLCDYFLEDYSQILSMPLDAPLVRSIGEELSPRFSGDMSVLHGGLFRAPAIAKRLLNIWHAAAKDADQPDLCPQTEIIHLVEALIKLSMDPTTIKKRKLHLSQHVRRRVLDFIATNLSSDLTLDTIAQIANFSEYHFLRAFKAEMGVTPHQYILDQRLQRAKHLLCKNGANIADIAVTCGFASHQHLSSTFWRLVGRTPRAFREATFYSLKHSS
jgi:AraC family transcriptional regulator